MHPKFQVKTQPKPIDAKHCDFLHETFTVPGRVGSSICDNSKIKLMVGYVANKPKTL